MRIHFKTPFLIVLMVFALLGCPFLSEDRGFVILHPDRNLFQFSNGNVFVPVGHNDWCYLPLISDPDRLGNYLSHMHANGENLLRVIPDGLDARVELRVGEFNPELVAGLDNLVSAAEKHGIYLILAFFQNQYTVPGGSWYTHPYNIDYDPEHGLVEEPEDLFTNPAAIKAIKNRIRFFVERWGASPNIFAWDLWNEISAFGKVEDQNSWIDEMGSFVKELEQATYSINHLRTASTSNAGWGTSTSGVYTSENLDFTSYHTYDSYGRVDVDFFSGLRYFSRIIPVPLFLFTYESARLAQEKSTHRPVLGTEDPGIVMDSGVLSWPFELWFSDYNIEQLDDIFTGCAWAGFMAGSAGPSLRWACTPLYAEGNDPTGFRALSTGMYQAQAALTGILSQVPLAEHAAMVPANDGVISARGQNGETFVSKVLWEWPDFMLVWLVEDSDDLRRAELTPSVSFGYLWGKNYRVTWYDLRTGKILRQDLARGPWFTLTAPSFQTFVTAAVEAIEEPL